MIRMICAAYLALMTSGAYAQDARIENRWGGQVSYEFQKETRYNSGRIWSRWIVHQDKPVPCLMLHEVLEGDLKLLGSFPHGPGTMFVLGDEADTYSEGWIAAGPVACLAIFVLYEGIGS